jgi:hypothetical protein
LIERKLLQRQVIKPMQTHNNPETLKAAYELAGMIYGISLDGVVTRNEFDALKTWCNQKEMLCEDEPFQKIFEKIKPIIQHGNVNHEELDEMNQILKSFLGDFDTEEVKHPNLFFLNGIFEGILASGDINTYEVYRLKKWMEKNTQLRAESPFNELIPLVESVLKDEKVDDQEAIQLKRFFEDHLL